MIDADFLAATTLRLLSQGVPFHTPVVTPPQAVLAQAIGDVFWSTLEALEGTALRVRIYFAPLAAIGNSYGIVGLPEPRPYSASSLRTLAPAHGPEGGLLLVEDSNGDFTVRGLLGSLPFVPTAAPLWLCVEGRGPGSIRVSVGFEPLLDYTRGKVRELGGMAFDRTFAESLLMSVNLFPVSPPGRSWQIASALLDCAFEVERVGHGGALWLLPDESPMPSALKDTGVPIAMGRDSWDPYLEEWEMRTSTIRLLNPGCDGRHEFLQPAAQQWDVLRKRAVSRTIACLALVDGAIVVNGTPNVLAFGVICNKFEYPVAHIKRATDPAQPHRAVSASSADFGGSRHRSAIDFCSTHAPAGALVASHDGGLTVFAGLERGEVIGSRISTIRSSPNTTVAPSLSAT